MRRALVAAMITPPAAAAEVWDKVKTRADRARFPADRRAGSAGMRAYRGAQAEMRREATGDPWIAYKRTLALASLDGTCVLAEGWSDPSAEPQPLASFRAEREAARIRCWLPSLDLQRRKRERLKTDHRRALPRIAPEALQ